MLIIKSVVIAGLLSIFSINALADTKIIINAVPPEREVIVVPRGYASCHIVPATYKHGVWVNQHRVCQYARGSWVSGHWECVNLKHHKSICMQWNWVPSQWKGAHVTVYNAPRTSPQTVVYAPPPVVVQPVAVQVRPAVPPPVIVSYNN